MSLRQTHVRDTIYSLLPVLLVRSILICSPTSLIRRILLTLFFYVSSFLKQLGGDPSGLALSTMCTSIECHLVIPSARVLKSPLQYWLSDHFVDIYTMFVLLYVFLQGILMIISITHTLPGSRSGQRNYLRNKSIHAMGELLIIYVYLASETCLSYLIDLNSLSTSFIRTSNHWHTAAWRSCYIIGYKMK